MSTRSVINLVFALAGSALGVALGGLALLRHGKPLHPHGVVFDAVVRRTGSSVKWDAVWLDAVGEDHGLARLSRAVGLPPPVPDIHGIAVTFAGVDGSRHDLLLATTGWRKGTRFMLMPTSDPLASFYSSLLPYRAPRGLVLLAAVRAPGIGQREGSVSFRLLAAGLVGPWRQFATLELTRRAGGERDEPLRFDPVLHELPGLRWPEPLVRLREPAYAAARRTPAAREH